jgi:hypothetical protein
MAGEHQEDKEGECFVWFGHGSGLTPSGITVKVRTCEERKIRHSDLTMVRLQQPD